MAPYSRSEMDQLHQKAVTRMNYSGSSKVVWLYRNKHPGYFTDIDANSRGIMKVVVKDSGGDPRCPINSAIHGLYFFASVEPGSTSGTPIQKSPFGSTRLLVPAEIMTGMAPNLYFADFFCLQSDYHYVTLVMTRPSSAADQFCRNSLVKLDYCNNPFFFKENGELRVSTANHTLVEVFFTEDLDLNYVKQRGAEIKENIPTFGRGGARGLRKDSSCSTCNIGNLTAGIRNFGIRNFGNHHFGNHHFGYGDWFDSDSDSDSY